MLPINLLFNTHLTIPFVPSQPHSDSLHLKLLTTTYGTKYNGDLRKQHPIFCLLFSALAGETETVSSPGQEPAIQQVDTVQGLCIT